MNTLPSLSCPRCGSPLADASLSGLCPKCLMARAASVTEDATLPVTQASVPSLESIAAAFPELEILELIGRGGMGVVYKARQKSLHRLVALKLLAPERVVEAQFAERFAKEAQALAALNHPNIVTVHDFGQAGGFYFLLMEFVDGVNLRQAMMAGRFTPEQALAIVPPVCAALQYAHEHGIVHRDIKPENLLMDKEGRVKIADFGIAKMLGAEATEAISQPVGTPRYMAPEQGHGDMRVDHRADIYSLGVVLYELLTGELPGSKLQPPSQRVQINVRLDEVVLRALNEKPELRWQTALEFQTHVQGATFVSADAPPGVSVSKQQQLFALMGFRTKIGQRLLLASQVGWLAFLSFIPGWERMSVFSVFFVLLAVATTIEASYRRFSRVYVDHRPWWQRAVAAIVIAVVIVIPLRTWALQSFSISGHSLEPEMTPGSHMLVWKLSHSYLPGDIVAHRHGKQIWVARVVRTQGDGLVLKRNRWPEETLPLSDIIGKVVSVYWRAPAAVPSTPTNEESKPAKPAAPPDAK